jgi:hypothetical protein
VIERGGQVRWQQGGVRAAALTRDGNPPKVAALLGDGQVQWLSATDGKVVQQVSADGLQPSAVSASSELFFVGERTGRLSVISQDGMVGQCHVSGAPLLRPVFDVKRRQLIAAGGDGELAAIVVGRAR